TAEGDSEAIVPMLDRWLASFEQQGIEAVGTGLITARKRSDSANWFRVANAPGRIAYPAGDEIMRTVARRDYLEAVSDCELLDNALQLAPGVQLTQESLQDGDQWKLIASHLRRTDRLEYSGGIDQQGAALLVRCDGRTPLRQLIGELELNAD